jgi:hypothetical protein
MLSGNRASGSTLCDSSGRGLLKHWDKPLPLHSCCALLYETATRQTNLDGRTVKKSVKQLRGTNVSHADR